jgi:tetratricopeptide (TPR) repeat protein
MKKLLTLLLTLFLYSSVYATEKLVQTQVQEVNIHQQWQRLHQQVVVLYKQGGYGEALTQAIKSLQFARDNIGEKHPSTASSLNTLAFIYHTLGDYQKAEPLYRSALSIRINTLGINHLDVARTQTNLALLTNHLGRFNEAEFLYKRALTSVEQSLGLFHADVAVILENLSLLYKDTNREQLSNKLHRRVLEIRAMQEKNKKEKL